MDASSGSCVRRGRRLLKLNATVLADRRLAIALAWPLKHAKPCGDLPIAANHERRRPEDCDVYRGRDGILCYLIVLSACDLRRAERKSFFGEMTTILVLGSARGTRK